MSRDDPPSIERSLDRIADALWKLVPPEAPASGVPAGETDAGKAVDRHWRSAMAFTLRDNPDAVPFVQAVLDRMATYD